MAASQHYVVHVSQAPGCDVSVRRLRSVATERDWERPFDGIIWLPGPDTPERWMMSGLLLVGEQGLITGRSALYLDRLLATAPTRVELLVPYGHAVPAFKRLHVRRTRTLQPEDRVEIDGLRATIVERTLNQMAHNTDVKTLRAHAIDARRMKLYTTSRHLACIDRMGNFPGAAKMRTMAAEIDEDESESIFEFLMRRRFVEVGLRPDAEQYTLRTPRRTMRLDIPWSQYLVGVECDSLGYHGSRADLDRDAHRHNSAHGTEWRVFRATWTHYDDDEAFAELCSDVRAALRARGHPHA